MSLFRRDSLDPAIFDYYTIADRAGFGKAQIWILFGSSFLVMHVFNELMGMAIIASAAQCDFEMGDFKKSVLFAAGFLGTITSSYIWSLLISRKGRKWVLQVGSSSSIVLSLVSSVMSNYTSFILMRFLVGIFLAGQSFSAVTYLMEFCPFKYRRLVINYMAMANGFAMIYCPSMAQLLLCCNWIVDWKFIEYRPWRVLMALYTLPGIMGLLLLINLPESPEFLLCSDRRDEVKHIMDWLHRLNVGETLRDAYIPHVNCPENPGNVLKFDKKTIFPLTLSCFIFFILFSVGNGLAVWFNDLRSRQTYDRVDLIPKTMCQEMNITLRIRYDPNGCIDIATNYHDSILLGLSFLVIFNIMGVLLLKIRRKYILIVSLIVCGISGIFIIMLKHHIGSLIAFLLFLAIPNVLVGVVIGRVIDLTSSKIRSKLVCMFYVLGRMGSVLGALFVGALISSNCELVFAILSTFIFIATLLAIIMYHKIDTMDTPTAPL